MKGFAEGLKGNRLSRGKVDSKENERTCIKGAEGGLIAYIDILLTSSIRIHIRGKDIRGLTFKVTKGIQRRRLRYEGYISGSRKVRRIKIEKGTKRGYVNV